MTTIPSFDALNDAWVALIDKAVDIAESTDFVGAGDLVEKKIELSGDSAKLDLAVREAGNDSSIKTASRS